jgi:hypothetical protein
MRTCMNYLLRIFVAAALTILADATLYGTSPGLGLTLFAVLSGATVWVLGQLRWRRVWPWLVLWCILAVGASVQTSWIGRLLLLVLTWTLLARSLLPEGSAFFTSLLRGIVVGGRSLTATFSDSCRRQSWTWRRAVALESVVNCGEFLE